MPWALVFAADMAAGLAREAKNLRRNEMLGNSIGVVEEKACGSVVRGMFGLYIVNSGGWSVKKCLYSLMICNRHQITFEMTQFRHPSQNPLFSALLDSLIILPSMHRFPRLANGTSVLRIDLTSSHRYTQRCD